MVTAQLLHFYAAIELARELDVKVINLSATTGYKIKADYVVEAIKEATKSGIKVICAAGTIQQTLRTLQLQTSRKLML